MWCSVAAALGNSYSAARQMGDVEKCGPALVPIPSSESEKHEPWARGSPQSLLVLMDKGMSGGVEALWAVMKVRWKSILCSRP